MHRQVGSAFWSDDASVFKEALLQLHDRLFQLIIANYERCIDLGCSL